MTTITKALLFAAILLVGGLWLWQNNRWVRQSALLQASSERGDSARAALGTANAERARLDSALSDSVAFYRRLARQHHARTDTLNVRLVAADSSLLARLPDSLTAPFREMVALRDSVIQGFKLQVEDLTAALEAQAQQLAIRATTVHGLELAVADAVQERDRWKRMARPPFALRLFRDLPKYGLGAGIALVVVTLAP